MPDSRCFAEPNDLLPTDTECVSRFSVELRRAQISLCRHTVALAFPGRAEELSFVLPDAGRAAEWQVALLAVGSSGSRAEWVRVRRPSGWQVRLALLHGGFLGILRPILRSRWALADALAAVDVSLPSMFGIADRRQQWRLGLQADSAAECDAWVAGAHFAFRSSLPF